MTHHPAALYNETHQSRSKPPSSYENLLGDSIERAFASGIHDLSELVNYLNTSGPATPSGDIWTTDNYQKEIARLAA